PEILRGWTGKVVVSIEPPHAFIPVQILSGARQAWACYTWFSGLVVLTSLIAFPGTTFSIVAAAVVFALGLILLVVYYRRSAPPKSAQMWC
ncbi:MAG: hypothetical protein ACRECJ_06430, partial [Limisphaerales bacterium]